MAVFQIPDIDQRVTIIGRTGSGKTQGGSFILSQSKFTTIPYVIIDYKRERLFSEIPEIRELRLGQREYGELSRPGLFIVRPLITEAEELDDFLWYVWNHENCGIFIDEALMLKKSSAYEACLTQGRSKNIPIISLTQRPRFVTPFVFSEAEYLMIFLLTRPEDRKTVQDYVDVDISKRLPPFYSYWFDAVQNRLTILRPVPERAKIIATIRERLGALQVSRPAIRAI